MTHDAVTDAPSAAGTAESEQSSTARLIGLDLARGLAVFGMYAVHVGGSPSSGSVGGYLLEFAQGRSSALFALATVAAFPRLSGLAKPVVAVGAMSLANTRRECRGWLPRRGFLSSPGRETVGESFGRRRRGLLAVMPASVPKTANARSGWPWCGLLTMAEGEGC